MAWIGADVNAPTIKNRVKKVAERREAVARTEEANGNLRIIRVKKPNSYRICTGYIDLNQVESIEFWICVMSRPRTIESPTFLFASMLPLLISAQCIDSKAAVN